MGLLAIFRNLEEAVVQEDWARQPWGKVTVPGHRGSCGAVLVIGHPGEPVGETFLEDPHPGFSVPPDPPSIPRTSHLPWARSYLSLWIWQSFLLSTLPSSSITSSLNWLLSSLQKTQGKSKSKGLENKVEKG